MINCHGITQNRCCLHRGKANAFFLIPQKIGYSSDQLTDACVTHGPNRSLPHTGILVSQQRQQLGRGGDGTEPAKSARCR
jgi:hypothetical protein